MYQVSRYQVDMSTGICRPIKMAICHPADLLTGLIMYKGLHIHLSVWIYEWVGRYNGGRWPDRHVYIDLYIWLPTDPSFYFSF